jgi:hypothetical protein
MVNTKNALRQNVVLVQEVFSFGLVLFGKLFQWLRRDPFVKGSLQLSKRIVDTFGHIKARNHWRADTCVEEKLHIPETDQSLQF